MESFFSSVKLSLSGRESLIKESILNNFSENAKEIQFEFGENGEGTTFFFKTIKFNLKIYNFQQKNRQSGFIRLYKFTLYNNRSDFSPWTKRFISTSNHKHHSWRGS